MTLWPIASCAALGLVITLVAIPVILRNLRRLGDRRHIPQFHHAQQAPVSRLGGLALALAFVVVCPVAYLVFPHFGMDGQTSWVIFACSLAMFALGFRDDLKPLGARRKLIFQCIVAAAACYGGVQIQNFKNPFSETIYSLGPWGPLITMFWLVSLTNLINLIDGIDGLAAGISLMLMGLICYSGRGAGVEFPVLVSAAMAGALLGFLRYNFPPAKIYMGDGGAYFLGFLIAALSAINSHKGTIATGLIAPLFVLALPIIDASLAMLRRALAGLPIFRADRKHIHHRLVDVGLSRTRTVLTLYFMTLIFLVLGLFASWAGGRAVPLLFGIACLVLLAAAGSVKFSRDWFSVTGVLGRSRERRKTTQYALTLARWLELEAERCDSIEQLWVEFQFMAGKFGFSRVKLTLSDGEKQWRRDHAAATDAKVQRENLRLHGAGFEFEAPEGAMSRLVFVHLCDLSSEAWHTAAAHWSNENNLPPCFASRKGALPDAASKTTDHVPAIPQTQS